jgi:hypothetical protein
MIAMNASAFIAPELAVQQELVKGGVKALQFDAHELGRWDSALMVGILALHDACASRLYREVIPAKSCANSCRQS